MHFFSESPHSFMLIHFVTKNRFADDLDDDTTLGKMKAALAKHHDKEPYERAEEVNGTYEHCRRRYQQEMKEHLEELEDFLVSNLSSKLNF